MEFKLKKRKYNCIDFIGIPMRCTPVSASLVTLQKILTALANVFQVIATAFFVNNAIDYVNGRTEFNNVIIWFAVMVGLIAWKRISWNIGRVFLARVENITSEKVRKEMIKKVGKIDYYLIEDNKTKKLINVVYNDIEKTISEMFQRTLNLFLYIIRIFGILIIIFNQIWWLALVIMALVIPLIIISLINGKKVYKADKEYEEFNRHTMYYSEVLTSRDSVNERTLYGYSDYVNDKWEKSYTSGRNVKFKARYKSVLNSNIGSLTSILLTMIMILIMVPLVVDGQMSLGMFIALATALFDIVKLMGIEMTRVVTQLAKYNSYMKDFTKFINLPEIDGATELPEKFDFRFESLEIKNLKFKYPNTDKYIINGLNLKIEDGKHYIFVGENGAGKSTIIKIITGLFDDYEGEILINNKNIKEYSKAQLKYIYSGVYQDFAKYNISIKDNIAIGNFEEFDNIELIREKTKLLGIDDDFVKLKNGYNTMVGKLHDESVDLSGGQWQKVAMARALVSNASIQILDEPTSALDPISESTLYEEFEKISKGRTTIFISHRLGAVKIADYIYLIHNGVVEESGTHDELIKNNGMYTEMYNSQKEWYIGGNE